MKLAQVFIMWVDIAERFSRSAVKGQGHAQTECYNGVFIFTLYSTLTLFTTISDHS